MRQAQLGAEEPNSGSYDKEINVIEVLLVLLKHKKLIFLLPLVIAIISAVICLMLPNIYRATTKLLPPQQPQSAATALLSQFGGAAGMAAGAIGVKNPGDVYIGMLKSRTIADRLIGKFDLKKSYETDSLEKARKKLETSTVISSGKDGLITIEVEDRNPQLAAQMANRYVEELFQLTKSLAVTEASQRRVFFGKQLEQAKNNLASAETSLQAALSTNGMVNVDTQSRAIMETSGRLRALASAKEIELNSMRSFLTETNPEFKRLTAELSSLRSELARLENGRDANSAGTAAQANNNKNAGQSIKLLRDVKYYQMLYELLAKQYEMAHLDEAKEPSIIQVLDMAIVPERKVKPYRALIVLVSAVLGLAAAIGIAFLIESLRKSRQSQEGEQSWQSLKTQLQRR